MVPVLDEAARLDRVLARLVRQAPPGSELLVVDGGSADRSVEIGRRHATRVLETPAGRGIQLARGAAEASGEVLLFLHADTRLADAAIPALLAEVGRGRADYGCFSQRILGRHPLYRSIEAVADLRARALGLVYGDSGLFVRAEAYRAAGGYPEWPLFEDVEISRRLARLRLRRRVLPHLLYQSPRRWERLGIVRATLVNWTLQARFLAGADPRQLAPLYRHQSPRA